MITGPLIICLAVCAWAAVAYFSPTPKAEAQPFNQRVTAVDDKGFEVTPPEFSKFRVIQVTDPDKLMELSKHCGWCTKYVVHAINYLAMGYVWQLKKVNRRRSSYQLFVSRFDSGIWEFKAKGNKSVRPKEFIEEHPELKGWLRAILPNDAFNAQDQASHTQATTNTDGSITLTLVNGTTVTIPLYEPDFLEIMNTNK